MGELNLIFDTDPAQVTDKGQAQPTAPAQEGGGEAAETTDQEAAEPTADGDESASGDTAKE
jgi:hypothetical protein